MQKTQLIATVASDERVSELKSKFLENGLPFDDIVDDIVSKNGWQEYGQLIKLVISILEAELAKALAKKPQTRVGRWLRIILPFLFSKK